jgi:hypothetical protein
LPTRPNRRTSFLFLAKQLKINLGFWALKKRLYNPFNRTLIPPYLPRSAYFKAFRDWNQKGRKRGNTQKAKKQIRAEILILSVLLFKSSRGRESAFMRF